MTASNGRGHGVHSPFAYELVRNVLMDKTPYKQYAGIEEMRRRLMRDKSVVDIEDLGAGPAGGVRKNRRVADIARRAAKPPRLGQLLFRLVRYYQPDVVVELGTSLGLSAAYLGAGGKENGIGASKGGEKNEASKGGRVWTIEGSPAVAARAKANLLELGLPEIEVIPGDFDVVLAPLLERISPVGLAFVDGNHRYEPTMRYFDLLMRHLDRRSMLVLDDIHWSAEMERAWETIKADPRVMLTVDLFFFGIVVKRDEFKVKQDFTIRL